MIVALQTAEERAQWLENRGYQRIFRPYGFFYNVYELKRQFLPEGITVWEIPKKIALPDGTFHICIPERRGRSVGKHHPFITIGCAMDGGRPALTLPWRNGHICLGPGGGTSVRAYARPGSNGGIDVVFTIKEYVLRVNRSDVALSVRVYRGKFAELATRCPIYRPTMLVAMHELQRYTAGMGRSKLAR